MIQSQSNNIFQSFFGEKANISNWMIIPIALLIAAAVYLSQDSLTGLIIFASILSLPLLWAVMKFPKLWVYLIVFSGIAYLSTGGKGVSAADVILGAVYVGGLALWFFYITAIKKEKIVRNTADWLIIFFYLAAFGNVCIAAINGVMFFDSLKEYLGFALTLLYFPIRHYFTDKNDLAKLFIALMIMLLFVDIIHFYNYYKAATTNLVYAYQLARTVRTNQAIFTAGAIFGVTFYFFTKGFFNRIALAAFAGITAAALVSTFSRAFWLVLLLQIVILFIFLSNKKKVELVFLTGIITSIILVLAFVFMKDNTRLLFGTVAARFTSASAGTKDVSVQARFAEYDATFDKIWENPLGGNGFHKNFAYLDPLTGYTLNSSVNHNAYIYLMYRTGLPMTAVYLLFMLLYFLKSIKYTFLVKDDFHKALALGAFLSFLLVIITNFVTPVISFRDGVFVMIFSVVAVSSAERYYLSQKQKEQDCDNLEKLS